MSGRPLKSIGIVGAGQIAEYAHLPALVARDDVSISWITDETDSKATRLARMYGTSSLPTKIALEKIPQLDVCLLAVPLGVRANYLAVCAAHNIAVYVEKPFAKSPDDHRALESQFPAHRLAVGFQRRFYQSTHYLKALVASSVFGKLRHVSVNFQNYSLTSGGGSYITDSRVAGGGVTLEAAIHLIDVVTYILPVRSVATYKVNALLENAIDYQVSSEHSLLLPDAEIPATCFFSIIRPGANGIEFTFEHAKVTVGLAPDEEITVRPLADSNTVFEIRCIRSEVEYVATTIAAAFACAWETFLSALEKKCDHALSAANTLVTTEWVAGIYGMIDRD